jgi:hypothetical protein
MAFTTNPSAPFQWRASTGRWRWLLLGTLGAAATSCWAQVETVEPEGLGLGTTHTPTSSPGTGTGTTSGTTPQAPGSDCLNPSPLGGGWERCENGLIHRAEQSGACSYSVPRAEPIPQDALRRVYPEWDPSASELPYPGACLQDSDCTARPLGHCELGGGGGIAGTYCEYGCEVDADCGDGMVCLCGEPAGRCVTSRCSTDADCAEGLCANFLAYPGCPSEQFACQTARDECVTDADCGELTCTVHDEYESGPKFRHCSPPTVVCGRPFLIAGDARRAEGAARADWYPANPPALGDAPELDVELRARVAQGWLEQGLMEHASIAAFARFSLQLLSLGAPAELVSESAQAMADEIAHARDCFALSRRHGGRDVGPAPLPLTGALEELELSQIVLGTIAEGCIGETIAALEAAEAHAHCQDEPTRAVLARISADETAHAQLAWRFVAWALEQGPASLRETVRAEFERQLSSAATSPSSTIALDASEHQLLQQGLVGPELRSALRGRVLHDVVGPCVRALLASPEPTRSTWAELAPAIV